MISRSTSTTSSPLLLICFLLVKNYFVDNLASAADLISENSDSTSPLKARLWYATILTGSPALVYASDSFS